MSSNCGPVSDEHRSEVLGIPAGHTPNHHDVWDALLAHAIWSLAENKNLGTFHDKMDLCSYAEWATNRALGLPNEKEEWVGVPRIVLTFNREEQGDA